MAEARKLELVEKMRAVRPVIETGWVRVKVHLIFVVIKMIRLQG